MYQVIDTTAPDNDVEVICPGCRGLLTQISNQAAYLTFGTGFPPVYDPAEPYLPVVGELVRDFDAFKYRAYTPAAKLPAGVPQADLKLIPHT